jgi:signal transduction histidine kinase/sensor domain CHASE-containing protein/ActR/RegA family two-component response regulator
MRAPAPTEQWCPLSPTSTLVAGITGGSVAVLGLAVLIGWYTNSVSLVQVRPSLAPMQVNTALCFVLCGLSLVALAAGRVRLVPIGSLLAAAVGLLTLCKYMFGLDLGLDQLVMRPSITVKTLHPGRMAPQTALCFLLIGIALAVIHNPRRSELARLVPGLLGAMVSALGLIACVGYVTGWQDGYSWKPFTDMAVHTAAGFVVLGLGAMIYAWRQHRAEATATVSRLPVMAGVGVIIMTLGLWQALLAYEHVLVRKTITLAATNLQTEIVEQVISRIQELVQVAARWEWDAPPPKDAWESDMAWYQQRDPYLQAIMWVDPAGRIRWVQPHPGQEGIQDRSLATTPQQRQSLDLARDSHEVVVTRTLDGVQPGGLQIIAPLFSKEDFGGFLISWIQVRSLLNHITETLARDFALVIFDGDEVIYGYHHDRTQFRRAWGRDIILRPPGLTWRMHIWPAPELPGEKLSALPTIMLFIGLATAILFASLVHFAQAAQQRAVQLSEANQALHHEIAEREHAETALSRRLEQLEVLRTMGAELTRELDLPILLHLMIHRATELVPEAASGVIFLWHEESGLLVPQVWLNHGDWMRDVKLALGEGVAGVVAQRREGLRVNEYGRSPDGTSLFLDPLGPRALIAEPLLYQNRLVGVIVLDSSRLDQSFSEADSQLLALFASQATIAIVNAQYVAERQQQATLLLQSHTALQEEMSERQRAEDTLRRQQEALYQSEKLAAMSGLLASVAHELNNPLTAITVQADLLQEESTDAELSGLAADISQAAGRCVRLVRHFLTLARQDLPEQTAVRLNEVVEDAMRVLAYTLQLDNIDVEQNLHADLPPLWADPHQLHQVVINLLTNAQQALHDILPPRRITLATRFEATPDRVIFEVADNGPGIPPELLERILEPFFTTKPPGVGTGLGLSLCQGIIDSHGGRLYVESQPGQGAVFRVELPVTEPLATAVEATEPEVVAPMSGKDLLIVDDEVGTTTALVRVFRRDGHILETAANGREALDKLRVRSYDLILCDLRMPELDGPSLYRALASERPHLQPRFVFLTGDTLSPEAKAFFDETRVPHLAKPFRAAEIRRLVQQALQRLARESDS